jgi:hypothetical protein
LKTSLFSSAVSSRQNRKSRSMPVRFGALALALLFTAAQMPAQEAQAASSQAATQREASAVPNTGQAATSSPAVAANVSLASSVNANTGTNALPDAPAAPPETSESANLNMTANMKAMMDAAAQNAQDLQPKPTSNDKKLQRPGMLVLGIAGIPLIAFGTWVLTRSVTKDASLKNAFGAAFLVPGGAMSGFGFYYAFHPKK